MTKEEAIALMKRNADGYYPKMTEALNMGIKALEQERSRSAEITQYRYDCEKLMEENEWLKKALEQEPCEDCISRFEAIEALNSINGTAELDKAFEVIESLPPATPKLQMIKNPCVECGCNYCTTDDCPNRYIVDIAESGDKE